MGTSPRLGAWGSGSGLASATDIWELAQPGSRAGTTLPALSLPHHRLPAAWPEPLGASCSLLDGRLAHAASLRLTHNCFLDI